MAEHSPLPWFASDWNTDDGDDKTTIEAREPEVLRAWQRSIWPGGIRKMRVADTSEGENPIEDAALIVRAVNAHDKLVAALMDVRACAQFELDHPTDMRDTAFSLIMKSADAVLASLKEPSNG